MGQVKTNIKVINFLNGNGAECEALVDTGAMYLSLPVTIIKKLQLQKSRLVKVKTTNGQTQRQMYEGGRIFIGERYVSMDILELPDGVPPLVGVLILEALDFVVDPIAQKLIPNPEHNGEYKIDTF